MEDMPGDLSGILKYNGRLSPSAAFMAVFAAGNALTGMPATLFDFLVFATGLAVAFRSGKNSLRSARLAHLGLALGCLAAVAAAANWIYWVRNPAARRFSRPRKLAAALVDRLGMHRWRAHTGARLGPQPDSRLSRV